jgi:TRAP-type C4-dicarboxylate transport system permease small subunit
VKKHLIWIYHNFEQIICGCLLSFLMGLLFVQVVSRYCFGTSFSWATELSRFSFLGLIYIATSLGAQKGIHIRVTAHLQLLPKKSRLCLAIITDLIWISFNILVIYQSALLILVRMTKHPLISAVMMWDMRFIFLIIPVGFLMQTFRIFEFWYNIYKGNNTLGGTCYAP